MDAPTQDPIIPSCFPPNLRTLWHAHVTASRASKDRTTRPTPAKQDEYLRILTDPTYRAIATTPAEIQAESNNRTIARRHYVVKRGRLYHITGVKYHKPQRVVLDGEVLGLMIAAHVGMKAGKKKKKHRTALEVFQRLRRYHDITKKEAAWLTSQCRQCANSGGANNKTGKKVKVEWSDNSDEEVSGYPFRWAMGKGLTLFSSTRKGLTSS